MVLASGLTVLAISLFLVQEGLRRAGKWIAWGPFLLLPTVLTPYWVRSNQQVEIFLWVKLYTMLFGACWITGLRYTSLGRWRWPLLAVLFLLVVNVLEAVVHDLLGGRLAHYLVAISGVLLIVTLPNLLHAIRIDESCYQDLIYHDMTRAWIAGYTLWNAAFVYLNFPVVAGHHIAVLAAAFVVGMSDPRRWLMARTYTLAFDMILLATFREFLTDLTNTSHWLTPYRENLVAALCIGVVGICSARFIVGRGLGNRHPRAHDLRPSMARLSGLDQGRLGELPAAGGADR